MLTTNNWRYPFNNITADEIQVSQLATQFFTVSRYLNLTTAYGVKNQYSQNIKSKFVGVRSKVWSAQISRRIFNTPLRAYIFTIKLICRRKIYEINSFNHFPF